MVVLYRMDGLILDFMVGHMWDLNVVWAHGKMTCLGRKSMKNEGISTGWNCRG